MNEQEMIQKIKELNVLCHNSTREMRELENQLKKIRIERILSNKILNKWAWKYSHGNGEDYTLLGCVKHYPQELADLSEYISVSIVPGVILGQDEGQVYLFGSTEDLTQFITEQNLQVDFSNLLVPYKEALKEIRGLKNTLEQFGVDYLEDD